MKMKKNEMKEKIKKNISVNLISSTFDIISRLFSTSFSSG